MSDQSGERISFTQPLEELNKCVSDLFNQPERQLQAAFAILVGMLREQAANQQKLSKSFDLLSDELKGKDLTILSCCNQIEKLSNDYQLFKGTNDYILQNIDLLGEEIKVCTSILRTIIDLCTPQTSILVQFFHNV